MKECFLVLRKLLYHHSSVCFLDLIAVFSRIFTIFASFPSNVFVCWHYGNTVSLSINLVDSILRRKPYSMAICFFDLPFVLQFPVNRYWVLVAWHIIFSIMIVYQLQHRSFFRSSLGSSVKKKAKKTSWNT